MKHILFSIFSILCLSAICQPIKSLVSARWMNYIEGNSLPYDAEVLYLESTGTQYINTQFCPDLSTLTCEIGVEILNSYSGIFGLFGVRTVASSKTQTNCAILCNPHIPSVRLDWTSYTSIPIEYGMLLEFICGSGSRVQMNGIEYISSISKDTGYIQYPFFLFAVNSLGSPMTIPPSRCYYCRLYDGENLVLDLIPVRKGGIGYMYDMVSGELFGNSGTGDFIIGQDKE